MIAIASIPQTSTGPPFDKLYAVDPDGLAAVRAWLDGFWDDALARYRRAAEGSTR